MRIRIGGIERSETQHPTPCARGRNEGRCYANRNGGEGVDQVGHAQRVGQSELGPYRNRKLEEEK